MANSREYHIIHAIGRGSFGTVYRAVLKGEGSFSKPVAVKILNANHQGWEEVARRLRDEARLLGMIQHRSILQVDGLVQIARRWAVVMEYVEGCSLRDIRQAGGMPVGAALEVIGEIAGALHVAYTGTAPDGSPLHLIHRDIKPDNILLTANGQVKLLDFGIARADFDARESETRSVVMGSIGYMAPERFDMRDGPEGDVYALAVTAYELITGERFKRTSANERKHREHIAERMEALKQKAGDHPEVIALIEQTLSFDEKLRPTARELEQACRALRRSAAGGWLSEWAEEHVPPLLPDPNMIIDDDELSGMTLMEGTEAEDFTSEVEQVSVGVQRRPSVAEAALEPKTLILVAGLALVVALAFAGVGLALLAKSEPAAPAPPALASQTPPPAADTDAAKDAGTDSAPLQVADALPTQGVELDAATEQPEEPGTEAPPAPKVAPTRHRPAKVAPAPEPSTDGVVTVSPPSVKVTLRGSAGDVSPDAVPPGSYDVLATFPGLDTPTVAGKLSMPANGALRLVCDSMFMVCTVR